MVLFLRRRRVALAAITLIVLAFLYLPIIAVLLNAFNSDPTLASWGGFTVKWFSQAATDPAVRQGFLASVEIALIVTALSVAIAICAALYWRSASRIGRNILDATTLMRIALPEVVLALSLFVALRRVNFPLGLWAVVIGHVVFTSAYATIIVQARVAALDRTLEDAAADLGASPRRVFLRVVFPSLMPAIVVAALLSFTFSFDDVVTSLFLSASETTTLPMLLLGLVRFRLTPEINAIGSGVMIVTLTTFSLALVALFVSGGVWRKGRGAGDIDDARG
jgi:spermidine/putrescine transport system permease protein